MRTHNFLFLLPFLLFFACSSEPETRSQSSEGQESGAPPPAGWYEFDLQGSTVSYCETQDNGNLLAIKGEIRSNGTNNCFLFDENMEEVTNFSDGPTTLRILNKDQMVTTGNYVFLRNRANKKAIWRFIEEEDTEYGYIVRYLHHNDSSLYFYSNTMLFELDYEGLLMNEVPLQKHTDVMYFDSTIVMIGRDSVIAFSYPDLTPRWVIGPTGRLFWSVHGNGQLLNLAQAENGTALFATRSNGVICMDLQTGQTLWELPRPQENGNLFYRSGEVFVMYNDTYIRGYDLNTGTRIWKVDCQKPDDPKIVDWVVSNKKVTAFHNPEKGAIEFVYTQTGKPALEIRYPEVEGNLYWDLFKDYLIAGDRKNLYYINFGDLLKEEGKTPA